MSKPRNTPRFFNRQLDGGLGQKRFDSERISEHVAAFERQGGHVEVLGTTRVLHKIDEMQATPKTGKTGS